MKILKRLFLSIAFIISIIFFPIDVVYYALTWILTGKDAADSPISDKILNKIWELA
jgi:hypothetical protein